jgi:hypothetical protein
VSFRGRVLASVPKSGRPRPRINGMTVRSISSIAPAPRKARATTPPPISQTTPEVSTRRRSARSLMLPWKASTPAGASSIGRWVRTTRRPTNGLAKRGVGGGRSFDDTHPHVFDVQSQNVQPTTRKNEVHHIRRALSAHPPLSATSHSPGLFPLGLPPRGRVARSSLLRPWAQGRQLQVSG